MNQHISYVVFDSASGRILGTHTRISGETGESLPMSDAEVISSCGVTLNDKDNKRVKVLAVDSAALGSRDGLRVHTKRQELVPRSHLEIKLSRTEIRGDGEDSVDIVIRVIQPNGKPDESFNGRIKVSTQRGRLSELGGIVEARGGVAKISLKSVPETIDQVRMIARDFAGELDPGMAKVAFL